VTTRIVRTPGTCSGKPRIDGTRITVADVCDWIEAGMTKDEIRDEYLLTHEQIDAALASQGEIHDPR
jgi:uncharacterized protein (DUF433 family)